MHSTNFAPNLTIISMKDKKLYECPAAEALEVNLETAGCVFLPAAGYREGTTVSCGPVGRCELIRMALTPVINSGMLTIFARIICRIPRECSNFAVQNVEYVHHIPDARHRWDR